MYFPIDPKTKSKQATFRRISRTLLMLGILMLLSIIVFFIMVLVVQNDYISDLLSKIPNFVYPLLIYSTIAVWVGYLFVTIINPIKSFIQKSIASMVVESSQYTILHSKSFGISSNNISSNSNNGGVLGGLMKSFRFISRGVVIPEFKDVFDVLKKKYNRLSLLEAWQIDDAHWFFIFEYWVQRGKRSYKEHLHVLKDVSVAVSTNTVFTKKGFFSLFSHSHKLGDINFDKIIQIKSEVMDNNLLIKDVGIISRQKLLDFLSNIGQVVITHNHMMYWVKSSTFTAGFSITYKKSDYKKQQGGVEIFDAVVQRNKLKMEKLVQGMMM